MSKYSILSTVLLLLITVSPSLFDREASAGIYSGPTDTTNANDPAITASDPRFTQWANSIDASRTSFAPGGSTTTNETGGFNSLGDLDATQISNGDSPGFLTVQFPTGISNGMGVDFAVFENASLFFTQPVSFAELAYVEVSTNGSDFARFESISLNTTVEDQFGRDFAGVDSSNIYNLAGKHASGFGTPFDLDELSSNALVTGGLLNLDNIQFVRMVDIPGDGSFQDSQGNAILDAWVTGGGAGGFDFRLGEGLGVGVLNAVAVPEPSSLATLGMAAMGVCLRRRKRRSLTQQTS